MDQLGALCISNLCATKPPQITSALIPDLGDSVDLPKLIIQNLFNIKPEPSFTPLNFKKILKHLKDKDIEWKYLSVKGEDVHVLLNYEKL